MTPLALRAQRGARVMPRLQQRAQRPVLLQQFQALLEGRIAATTTLDEYRQQFGV